jgi:hypothetical protein
MFYVTDKEVRRRIQATRFAPTWIASTVFAVTMVVILAVVPLRTLAFWVGIGISAGLFFYGRSRWRKRRAPTSAATRAVAGPDYTVILVALTGYYLLVSGMWLPLERVSTSTSNQPIVGYVLESTPEWTTLLKNDREIEILSTSVVEERSVCRHSGGVTIGMLVTSTDATDSPDCTE